MERRLLSPLLEVPEDGVVQAAPVLGQSHDRPPPGRRRRRRPMPLHHRALHSLSDLVWRLWVWPGSAFGLTAMEPWEMALSIVIYIGVLYFLGLFILSISPFDLARRLARLMGFEE